MFIGDCKMFCTLSKDNVDSAFSDIFKREKRVILILLIVIFSFLLLMGGVKTYPDSESYLKMSLIREPLYPLLINGIIKLCGVHAYEIIGIIQAALAVISIYMTVCYVGEQFGKRYVFYLVFVCMVVPHLLTPLFASSRLILTNALISEGITVSLYNFFFLFMLKAIWEDNNRNNNLRISLFWALVLSLARGQMIITLIAWFIIILGVEKRKKKICAYLFVLVISLISRSLLICGYNSLFNGKFTGTTYGAVTILSNVIYVSEENDGERIEDKTERQFFEDIYEIAKENGMLLQDAPKDFSAEAVFFSQMHDTIKEQAIYPILENYVINNENITEYADKSVRIDELSSSLTAGLLKTNWKRWGIHYLSNVLAGLIRTVAYIHPICNILTLAGYLLLSVLGLYCYKKDKHSRAVKFQLLTFLLTFGNISAVALTIMCLSRYMIYNMAFVYISGILLLDEAFKIRNYEKGEIKERKKYGIQTN